MNPRYLLILLLAGCDTDDFIIHGDSDGCSTSDGEIDLDGEPTTSSVIEAPPPAMSLARPGPEGPAIPLDSDMPGPTPAQEPR